ncbi:hypothetical protein M436DRAFT_60474 [Aureobasidium namibiae CBS 147.97]|uniref:Uncharacterized protein n=1 Tax=Aureobasidium namibiae CBS 147.97 TaxID=1043004 RepID=A0A074XPZ7_9PEZI|nr:uncharacterized protein M436DRAFT_60474 [Aureobasidium namibiae CBS 147.97]KEQ76651.1 hypothetical protein M436DRAFT_60474 [Aureobasidium namibiae CBS 147.97]
MIEIDGRQVGRVYAVEYMLRGVGEDSDVRIVGSAEAATPGISGELAIGLNLHSQPGQMYDAQSLGSNGGVSIEKRIFGLFSTSVLTLHFLSEHCLCGSKDHCGWIVTVPAYFNANNRNALLTIDRPHTDYKARARTARAEVEDLQGQLLAVKEAAAEVLDLKSRLSAAENALEDERRNREEERLSAAAALQLQMEARAVLQLELETLAASQQKTSDRDLLLGLVVLNIVVLLVILFALWR